MNKYLSNMKYILIILLLASCNSKPIDNHQSTIDSLQSEIFVKETIIMRYEITLEMLKETDSIAAQKFEYILYTQTE